MIERPTTFAAVRRAIYLAMQLQEFGRLEQDADGEIFFVITQDQVVAFEASIYKATRDALAVLAKCDIPQHILVKAHLDRERCGKIGPDASIIEFRSICQSIADVDLDNYTRTEPPIDEEYLDANRL